eukprot:CAMPEP_0196580378 /NCGR_PEP_ID=MMETSP1081-20130531/28592_1 /TAXON_ID=36882 /ORGANISM="Pyramimonas amylifera, Strain CCMP720" /LENGTH=114 /DNA_ID=CAMNT_0041900229 /DNA_START=381 /DNA_END=723 /DNA_ORIENTATION=+
MNTSVTSSVCSPMVRKGGGEGGFGELGDGGGEGGGGEIGGEEGGLEQKEAKVCLGEGMVVERVEDEVLVETLEEGEEEREGGEEAKEVEGEEMEEMEAKEVEKVGAEVVGGETE